MKKIMFDDKFGLTQAVLEGRKTMTRRVAKKGARKYGLCFDIHGDIYYPQYVIGERVAIAQRYSEVMQYITHTFPRLNRYTIEGSAGYNNKMFVDSLLMPHHILITNVEIQRLNDISHTDCLREGITTITEGKQEVGNGFGWDTKIAAVERDTFFSPRRAFAHLIEKMMGKGTWVSNPLVFVYEFKLID